MDMYCPQSQSLMDTCHMCRRPGRAAAAIPGPGGAGAAQRGGNGVIAGGAMSRHCGAQPHDAQRHLHVGRRGPRRTRPAILRTVHQPHPPLHRPARALPGGLAACRSAANSHVATNTSPLLLAEPPVSNAALPPPAAALDVPASPSAQQQRDRPEQEHHLVLWTIR